MNQNYKFNFMLNATVRAFLIILMFCTGHFAHSQVVVVGSTGADGSYSTLKRAFDNINKQTIQTGNDIVITITASTSEVSTASLTGHINSWRSLTIYPILNGLSISGNMMAPLINLNGANNVCIDGRVNASGVTKDLTIINTSISNGSEISTIRFINDASNNTVEYCNIQGSGQNTISGIIVFGTTSGKNGNDNNTIDNNDITSANKTHRPINVIYSVGSASKLNENITISNNSIHDFLSSTFSSNGVFFSLYTTDCTIINNSFYESSSFSPSTASTYTIIKIDNPYGSGFTVSGNYIGGQDEFCGGDAWTKLSMQNNVFDAIYLKTNRTRANSIQMNTIQNFAWSNSDNATWCGINIISGIVNIGNEIGNSIGSPINGSITITGALHTQVFYGIQISSTDAVKCQNNVIESVMLINTPTNANNFFGIYKSSGSGSTNISNNRIGSTVYPNSIIASSSSWDDEQLVYGIYNAGNSAVTINNNIIANLTNGTNNTETTAKGLINGITTIDGKNTITNNTVSHLCIGNTNDAVNNYASVGGIVHSNTVLFGIISGNTIHDLSNTNTSFLGSVYGVFFTGGASKNAVSDNTIYNLSALATMTAEITGIYYATSLHTNNVSGNTVYHLSLPNASKIAAFKIVGISFSAGIGINNTVTKNYIHSFSTNDTSSQGQFYGIKIISGTSLFSNNIVCLGGNTNTTIFGICDAMVTYQSCRVFHNTVYLSGTRKYGSNKTYGLHSSSAINQRNYQKNIFFNALSNDGANGKHFAIYLAYTTNTELTIDNNDYYAPGSGGVLGYHALGEYIVSNEIATLSDWKLTTGQDENSKNSQPNFIDVGGLNPAGYQLGDAYLSSSNDMGISVDYGDNPRLQFYSMGAWEYVFNSWKGSLSNDWSTPGNWTQKVIPSSGADLIFDENALNDCFLDQDRSVNGVVNSTTYNLNVNQHQLSVHGAIVQTANGKINASSPNSTIIYAGARLQMIEANQFVEDKISILTVENEAGLEMHTNFEVGELNIKKQAKVTIQEQVHLTVTGATNNNAGVSGIVIQSSELGTGSFNHNTDHVSATVKRYIGSAGHWKFVSSPVTEQSISGDWTPNREINSSHLSYDLHVYDEPSSCWVYDQNATVTPTWLNVHPQLNFVPGKGYLYALQTPNQTNTFAGTLNNGNVAIMLTTDASDVTNRGFNLVGNPYPNSIDWSFDGGFNRSILEKSGEGYNIWIWNASANNYGVFNSRSMNDFGTNGVSRYIAPMQAFFVRANGNANLIFNNTARTNLGADNWLKAPANQQKEQLILTLYSTSFGSDEVKLDFGYKDNQSGALKLFSPVTTAPNLYLPFEKSLYSVRHLTDTVEVKSILVGFKAGVSGEYTLQCIPTNTTIDHVCLLDKETHLIHSFAESPVYIFKASHTEMSNRFEIYFSSISSLKGFLKPRVYLDVNQLMVDLSALCGDYTMSLNDITGRTLKTIPMKGGELISIPLFFRGTYILTVVSSTNSRCDFKVIY